MTLLKAEGITKRFPGVVALAKVNLTIQPGEVHCIVGENGAGKSTLVKILTGLYKPDEGTLTVEENAIAYVPQEINLFDHLSVAENIMMPLDGRGQVFFNRRQCERDALKFMSELQMESDPSALVKSISVAEKQLLQIARALANSAFKLLILDEPTASLTKREIEKLFGVLDALKAQGKSIIFITHRLDEVMRLHDQVTVLRNGEVVGHSNGQQIDEEWIVRQMTGKDIDLEALYRPTVPAGDVLLDVQGLTGARFSDVSFNVRAGEILGVAGLVGAGRSEIMQTVFGLLPRSGGQATYLGEPWTFGSPAKSIRKGVIYLSEERKTHGIFPHLSIRQNVAAGLLRTLSQGGFIRHGAERETSSRIVADYKVKTPSDQVRIVNLSGGNQQKVLIGRALEAAPRVLFLDEPTRGIDVNAKDEIYILMKRIAEEQRMAIVLISSELEELLKCCNRIITVYNGRLNGEIPEDRISKETVINAIIGADHSGGKNGNTTNQSVY